MAIGTGDRTKTEDGLFLAGLALLGLAGGMWLNQKAPATPAPKPTPTPTPTPTPVPIPTPPPSRQQVVCGCAADVDGNCSTWCSTLWGIAAHWYGDGSQYPRIYAANAGLIEQTAQAHGFASSGGGHWIFPGMVLVIP